MTAVVTPTLSPADQAAAAAKVNQAMQAILPNVRVGFEVFDRVNGTVLISQDADRQVASMSVVKLLIALDALARENGVTRGSTMPQELHQMLATSDDRIASKLWTAGGGPAIVTRMVRLLDLTGTRPPDDPGAWGETRTTPQDMVRVYRYITDHLPNADQHLVLGALAATLKIAADGFGQHFGIPDGMPQLRWAVKQGWGTSGSQAVMNSTGLVGTEWRYIVVMLASAPARSYATLPTVVTAGAEALASLACAAAS
ncbi:MAG: hypothetical protein ACRDRA_13240 [Pseudonocardiaceae bacterium]